MIDRQARKELAEALRALASGLISNDEFERRIPDSTDPAIRHLFADGAWRLYSDLREYRLKGKHRLDSSTKAAVARWVLFLKTDQPFEWPQPRPLTALALLCANLITLGFAARHFQRRYRTAGDWSVWPFISRAAYEHALTSPHEPVRL